MKGWGETVKKLTSFFMACILALCFIGQAGAYGYHAHGDGTSYVPVAVDGGENHTVVLYSNGTVAAIGSNTSGQCNVSGWTNIQQIAAGFNHTVGLRADGTVVAAGSNSDGQCNVGTWRDIVQVAAGQAHTLGLRRDGTVVATGRNWDNQCRVENWRGITQIGAAMVNSVGMTAKGQLMVRGAYTNMDNFYINGWSGLSSMGIGTGFFAGIYPDGSVVGLGHNTDPNGYGYYDDISVSGWRNVKQLAVGRCNAFGLTWYGTVLCSGRNDFGQIGAVQSWSDISYIAAGVNHVIGIQSDGALVAAGDTSYGKCDVASLGSGSSFRYTGSTLITELPCVERTGKLWIRSSTPLSGYHHTPSDAPGCWSDLSTPGQTCGTVQDKAGNVYTLGMHLDGSESKRYSISYALNGNYTTFSGVCGYPADVINRQWTPVYTKSFSIYGDGRLLYTSPSMNASTASVPFSFSVRGVSTLTLVYPGTDGPNEAATLFDPTVS